MSDGQARLGILKGREDMVDAFRYIEDSQTEFITMFKPIRSQAALNVLNAIDKHVSDLRGGLILEEQFDRSKAIELGATCDGPAGERMPTFYGGYIRDTDNNKICFYKMG